MLKLARLAVLYHLFLQASVSAPFFEDTEHLSMNWYKGESQIEVVDGNTGKIDPALAKKVCRLNPTLTLFPPFVRLSKFEKQILVLLEFVWV